jgi:hypothetical protein
MKTLNIHWHSRKRIVGQAIVDDEYFDQVSKFAWYISDLRHLSPPKVTMRVGSTQKAIYLNRLVFLLSQTPATERDKLISDKVLLFSKMHDLQRIKILSENKFDCRLENLDGTLSDRSILHEKLEAKAKDIPTSALPKGFGEAPQELKDQFINLTDPTTAPPSHYNPAPPAANSYDPDLDIELPPVIPQKSVLASLAEADAVGNDKGPAETIRDVEKRERESQ